MAETAETISKTSIIDQKSRPLLFLMALVFVGLAFWDLDRLPEVHGDEAAILAPGYRFFDEGIFGSRLAQGFHEQDRIYLETMPLMLLLQGLSAHIFGQGVVPMRILPVALGLCTLLLTYLLAARWVNRKTALLACLLLLIWPWTTTYSVFASTGIPLLDISRIGRYDILVPPLVLAGLACWLKARQVQQRRWFLMCGVSTGLAGLANMYGLFFCAVYGAMWILARKQPNRPTFTHLALTALGVVLTVAPWALVMFLEREELSRQWLKHGNRLSLFDPGFLLQNIRTEYLRFQLGLDQAQTLLKPGFWLFLVGVPAAIIFQSLSQRRTRIPAEFILAVILFPLLLMLLIDKKSFPYLLVVIPLAVILVSDALLRVSMRFKIGNTLLILLAAGLTVQAGLALRTAHKSVADRPSGTAFFQELRSILPEDATVLGPAYYAIALNDRPFRDIGHCYLVSYKEHGNLPFKQAMSNVRPDYLVTNPHSDSWLEPHPAIPPAGSAKETAAPGIPGRT